MSHTDRNKVYGTWPTDIALKLAALGMHVFQIWSVTQEGTCRCPKAAECKSPGKHPIRNGGFKEATRDDAKIMKLAAERPDAQWAIACEASGITVLDVDYRHDGEASLRAWESQHGRLPATLKVKTGNGALKWSTQHSCVTSPQERL